MSDYSLTPEDRDVHAGRFGRMSRVDPHTLVGAYVMDAVTDGDRVRFERHLVSCETCRAEVRGLREATARLAAAATIRPRAELREQTVLAAGQIRQLPPVTREEPANWPPALRAVRRGLAGLAGVGQPRAWLPRLAVAVVAVFAGATIAMGAAMHGAEHRLDMATGRTRQIAVVLSAPDATMRSAQVSRGGSATVVMSHRARTLVLTAAGLPALSHARSYQLWLMGPAGPHSAGLLPPFRNGMTDPMVISGLAPGERVIMTIEPAGGSVTPTSPSIMTLGLGR